VDIVFYVLHARACALNIGESSSLPVRRSTTTVMSSGFRKTHKIPILLHPAYGRARKI